LLPRHVAIIMDGNGRWAQRQGWERVRGHRAGADAVREAVVYSGKLKIDVLTLYAFSTENWKRPRREIQFLMNLLQRYLDTKLQEMQENGVRLTAIGRLEALPEAPRQALARAMGQTARNSKLVLCLALNYGAQDEILEAARRLCAEAAQGKLDPARLDCERFAAALYTAHLPPVDLLIRTAGEQRLSNFLLWQACGAFFHVTEACWPEFRRPHFRAALLDYAAHQRSAAGPPG
jgi:undecaprenyl diphosphate synthase